MNYLRVLFCLTAVYLTGCAAKPPVTFSKSDSAWKKSVEQSPIFAQNHTGFALFDLQKQQMVAQHNAERYFVPASNTKLFTFFAGLSMLGDSLPALRYVTRGDSLIFWGTGDPSFLNPELPASGVLDFLKNWPGKLFFSASNHAGKRFGLGWSWDDFGDYYQSEMSPFPIHGNVIRFKINNQQNLFSVQPAFFRGKIEMADGPAPKTETKLVRKEFENVFKCQNCGASDYSDDVPYVTSPELTTQLLSALVGKEVGLLDLPLARTARTLFSVRADEVYQKMLQESDNMMAEQIMLMCAAQLDSLPLQTETGIEHVQKTFLNDLPDAPEWVDGSGLSRHNLFTPRSIVKLLQKIHEKVPQERLFGLLAIGGKAGTLKNQYKAAEPFVFAKTGTLGGCYNLSGYLRTKSGKILVFSFMNNNFVRKTVDIRREVEQILTNIRDTY